MRRLAVYAIVVGAALDPSWSAWFDGMAVEATVLPDGTPATRLCGEVADQPALFGILLRIRDLNLELIRVERMGGG